MARQRRHNAQPVDKPTREEKKQKSTHLKRTIILVLSIVLVVILTAAVGLYGIRAFLGTAQSSTTVSLDTDVDDEYKVGSGTQDSDNKGKGPKDGAIDYLLVGADSRVDMQGNPLSPEMAEKLRAGDVDTTNTDVIMVLRVAADGSQASAVSIPRDTYISDRQFGNTKINGVYGMHQAEKLSDLGQGNADAQKQAADAGRQGLTEAVASLTGVTVDHYVEVGLVGFSLFTDAVGGVDVCLNNATEDPMTGASFPAGQQTLDGAQALSFVRQRYGLANGDLDRVRRQQTYLTSMGKKLLSAGTLANPKKLKGLLDAVEQSVAIDDNLNLTEAATTLSKIDPSNITFETIPVITIAGHGDHGESVVEVDTPTVQNFFAARAGSATPDTPRTDNHVDPRGEKLPEDMAVIESVPSARVFSVGADEDPARDAAKRLTDDGIVVTDVAMAPSKWSSSGGQVLVRSSTKSAQRIGELLGLPVVEQRSLPEGTVVALVGAPSSEVPAGELDSGEAEEFVPSAPPVQSSEATSVEQGVVCVN